MPRTKSFMQAQRVECCLGVKCSALTQVLDFVTSFHIRESIALTLPLRSCQVENQMVSAERVLGYCRVPQEASLESEPGRKPKDDWPAKGAIEVRTAALLLALSTAKRRLFCAYRLPFLPLADSSFSQDNRFGCFGSPFVSSPALGS